MLLFAPEADCGAHGLHKSNQYLGVALSKIYDFRLRTASHLDFNSEPDGRVSNMIGARPPKTAR